MANTEKIIFLNNILEESGSHMFADDQRTSKRFTYEAPIIIENCDSGAYSYGRMYNYSLSGIYFETDVAFQPGTRIRIDIEKSSNGLDSDLFFAIVKWCQEISAAVVLYDYGIGVEFERSMDRFECTGRLKVIQGGTGQEES